MTAPGLKFVPAWTRDVPRAAVSAAATQAVKANTATASTVSRIVSTLRRFNGSERPIRSSRASRNSGKATLPAMRTAPTR
jgi:hypothetical protein